MCFKISFRATFFFDIFFQLFFHIFFFNIFFKHFFQNFFSTFFFNVFFRYFFLLVFSTFFLFIFFSLRWRVWGLRRGRQAAAEGKKLFIFSSQSPVVCIICSRINKSNERHYLFTPHFSPSPSPLHFITRQEEPPLPNLFTHTEGVVNLQDKEYPDAKSRNIW